MVGLVDDLRRDIDGANAFLLTLLAPPVIFDIVSHGIILKCLSDLGGGGDPCYSGFVHSSQTKGWCWEINTSHFGLRYGSGVHVIAHDIKCLHKITGEELQNIIWAVVSTIC